MSAMSDIDALPAASTPGAAGGDRRATQQAAERILTFAVESLDMLRSVTAIFSESVERADAYVPSSSLPPILRLTRKRRWVERLRIIGIQHRQRQQRATVGGSNPTSNPSAAAGRVDMLDSSSEADDSSLAGEMNLDRAYRSASQSQSQVMTPSESGDSLTSQHLAALGSSTATNLGAGVGTSTTKRRKANGGAPAPVPATVSAASIASPALSSEYDGSEDMGEEEGGLRRKKVQRT